MSLSDDANMFFDACETGKGWDVCKQWCHSDATFSAQANALAEVNTLNAYCQWMKGLLDPVPDGHYKVNAMAVDDSRHTALVFAEFHGTNTGEGPVPPTGNTVASDYVYSMKFHDGKIQHMTKIWNDGHALAQLGWA